MALTAGSHHIATLTADMDRLIAFYQQVSGAEVQLDMPEEGLRHVFLDLGGGFVLRPTARRRSGPCASGSTTRAPATAGSPTSGRR